MFLNLQLVFQNLRERNRKIQLDKLELFRKNVVSGTYYTPNGIKTKPHKNLSYIKIFN